MLQWTVAESEREREDGVRLLCRHAEELGVPYNWSTVMASLDTAICDNGLLIGTDGLGHIQGVLAYTFWTGEDGCMDNTRIEAQLLYLKEGWRGRKTLAGAMAALVERVRGQREPVGEIFFYSVPSGANHRRYGKFATERGTEQHPCGPLSLFVTTPERLGAYAARLRSHIPC